MLGSNDLKIIHIAKVTFSKYLKNYMQYTVFKTFLKSTFENKAKNADDDGFLQNH